MKILFVYFEVERYSKTFYQGIGSIAACLKKAGHEVALIDMFGFDKDRLDAKLDGFAPNIVAISSTIRTISISEKLINYVKTKDKKYFVVIGGVHATIAPETLTGIKGLDGICQGEGEEALVELADKLEDKKEYKEIQNFWFLDNGTVIKNPVRPLIRNLDELPFADREIFDFDLIINSSKKKKATFMATRGCNHDCTYCANHAIKRTYTSCKSFFRFRSPENIIEEIKDVINRYPSISFVTFQDDTLAFSKKWLREFSILYKNEINLPFCCNARVDEIDEEIADILKDSGCVEVRMGVEAGNDYIRNKILKKNISKEQIIRAFDELNKRGIKTVSLNMIGLPYETEEMINETIELNRRCNAKSVRCTIFEPRVGTEAYDLVKENGWLGTKKFDKFENGFLIGKFDVRAKDMTEESETFDVPIISNGILELKKLEQLHEKFLNEFNK